MTTGHTTQGAGRVQAAFTDFVAEQATTSSYVEVGFDFNKTDLVTEIAVEHAVSLCIWASSADEDSLIKVEHMVCRGFGEWKELVAEQTLTADAAATIIYADVIRAGRIRIRIKESVAGGTVTVGGICK